LSGAFESLAPDEPCPPDAESPVPGRSASTPEGTSIRTMLLTESSNWSRRAVT